MTGTDRIAGMRAGLCAEPAVGRRVVLVCQSCQDAWEPDLTEPANLDGAQTGCRRCGGWTWLGEVTEPDPAPAEAGRAER